MREIINATTNDIDEIMHIFDIAKSFMRETGNLNQWINGYPSIELILDDIKTNNFYIVKDDNKIVGCFYYYIGNDITYNYIEGKWLQNDTYGTIHRIASLPSVHNVLKDVIAFCKSISKNEIKAIRVDTHSDNKVMQHVLLKNGFSLCGTIYLVNGDPRLAYELIL